jgi:hypothetical protein
VGDFDVKGSLGLIENISFVPGDEGFLVSYKSKRLLPDDLNGDPKEIGSLPFFSG